VDQASGQENAAESFRVCREEIQHEYSILSNRLSSYITSQSFLVTGYAISLGASISGLRNDLRLVFSASLCLLGIALSVRAMPGIAGASRVIELWHGRQSELLASQALPGYQVMLGEEYRQIQKRSLDFSKASVWLFGCGWVVFLAVAIGFWVSR